MVHHRVWGAARERHASHLLSCPPPEVCMLHHRTPEPNMVEENNVLVMHQIRKKSDHVLSIAGMETTYYFEV
jgi:hypothetical protein